MDSAKKGAKKMDREKINKAIKMATGKELNWEPVTDGFKITSDYLVTRGDTNRIIYNFQIHGICARMYPGRYSKIWIKPNDRGKFNL